MRSTFVRVVGGSLFTSLTLMAACGGGGSGPSEATDEAARVGESSAALAIRSHARPLRPAGEVNPDSSYCQTTNPGHTPKLNYYGGPLIQNPKVYNVNWGTHVNSKITTQMPLFYPDLVASSYWDWLSEYNSLGATVTGGHASSNQGISRGSYAGSITITPSVCAGTGACALSDAQIQSELAAQVASGALPAPVKGCDGQVSTIYMINFIAAVTVTNAQSQVSCVDYCGYHGSAPINGMNVPYSVLPDLSTGPCAPATTCATPPCKAPCGLNNTDFVPNATAVASHELIEATTDTDVGLATTVGYPLSWYDTTCGEIGDICAYIDGSIVGSNGTWTVQTMWDNASKNCISTKALTPICASAGATGCRKCTCADNNQGATGEVGCSGATPWCETDTTNIKDGLCVQCTTNTECSGTTCTKSSVVATDDTCACTSTGKCASGATCGSGVDNCGATISCGTCTAPQTCGGGGTTGACGCTSNGKCASGATCGSGTDNCGKTISCGTCTAPQTCGGGGTTGACGCTSTGKCASGATCGSGTDNCGTTISCGTCSGLQTCGGGGVAGVCGCTSTNTCTSGATCGSGTDSCGATISCGTCTGAQTCGGGGVPGACGCTSTNTCTSGATCGSGTDNCGATISCGTCVAPQTCGGGGVPGACGESAGTDAGANDGGGSDAGGSDAGTNDAGGSDAGGSDAGAHDGGGTPDAGSLDAGPKKDGGSCVPTTCTLANAQCGTIADTCGGMLQCGACPNPGDSCNQNTCVASVGMPDSGGPGDDGGGIQDASSNDGSSDTGGNGTPSGCGCRVAGAEGGSQTPNLAGFGFLGLVGLVRLRRQRRRAA